MRSLPASMRPQKLFARRIRLHAVNFPRAALFGEAAAERNADEQDKEHRRKS